MQEDESAADNLAAIELDADQMAIVNAPANARTLVTAGAGQGKTEVVAARVDHLAASEGLSPSVEILVLSFSRAAVAAVRRRTAERDSGTPHVRTFDSFASFLLGENDVELHGGFDHRIREATKLLKGQGDLAGVEDLRHVIFDEVQDLVGDRAELVLALLGKLGDEVGFTALGDPLQGIYDFTLEESRSKRTSDDFRHELVANFGARVLSLSVNYRAQGRRPKDVVRLGIKMRDEPSNTTAAGHLKNLSNTFPHSGIVSDWSFLYEQNGSVAVLCATNGEVLRVSRVLSTQNICHVVRRNAEDFGAARWIADVFDGMAGPEVARGDVVSRIEEQLEGILRDEAWYRLKAAESRPRSKDQLNLHRIRGLISGRGLPLELTEPDSVDIVVSTIHRAKGLEFDSVYFVHPDWVKGDPDSWARLRERYVALSRARHDIAVVELPSDWSWFEDHEGRLRERKKSKKGNRYTRAFEVKSDDAEVVGRADTGILAAQDVQEALREVDLGTPVTGVAEPALSHGKDIPAFVLTTSSGSEIGMTGKQFGRYMNYEFGYRFKDEGWDGITIEGMRLTSVETAAGDPRLGESVGLGPSGLWLIPRLGGLVAPVDK
ncbi:ATP-dependent helicase [Rhodococcoides navarretei]|uniref:ATP-dependent helicase n=1 Tax=Rhodococcus navarretei TaxID=3128981 RepID=A0ABU9CTZ2_9NOCA